MSFHGFLDFLYNNDELTLNSLPKNMQEKIFSNFMKQQKGFYVRYPEELKNTNTSKTLKTLTPFFRRQFDEQLRVKKRLTDIMNRGISRRNMAEDLSKFRQAIRQHIAKVFYLDRKSINGRRNIRLNESEYKRHEARIVEYFFERLTEMLHLIKENKFKNLTTKRLYPTITESPVSPLEAIFRIVTALAYDLAFSLQNTLKKYKPYVDRVFYYIVGNNGNNNVGPLYGNNNVAHIYYRNGNNNNNGGPANVPAMRNSLQNVNKWVKNTYRNFQPELNTLRRSAFNTEYQIAKK